MQRFIFEVTLYDDTFILKCCADILAVFINHSTTINWLSNESS